MEPLLNPIESFTVVEVAGIDRLADRLRFKETLSRGQRCRVQGRAASRNTRLLSPDSIPLPPEGSQVP